MVKSDSYRVTGSGEVDTETGVSVSRTYSKVETGKVNTDHHENDHTLRVFGTVRGHVTSRLGRLFLQEVYRNDVLT